MSKLQIAIIWGYPHDSVPWGGCTGHTHHGFWESALRDRSNIDVHRFTWDNWKDMPTGLDLYLFVDFHPSLFEVGDTRFHPRIFTWWDSIHTTFVYQAQVIEHFDRAYFPEYYTVKALQGMGVTKVKWLPAAFYPRIYRPIMTQKTRDFAFVGQPDNVVRRKKHTRKEFIERLSIMPGINNPYVGQGCYGHQLNEIYNQSKVLIDRTIYCNLGTRFYETIGSGGFLLMNRSAIPNGLDEVAVDGQHFISYDDSLEDCYDKLTYYLHHDAERFKIARNGSKFFLENHTYSHRLDSILKDFGL